MSMYDKTLNDGVVELWTKMLSPYAIEDISDAFHSYLRNSEYKGFAPKAGDIIGIIEEKDGRPGPEVAWAMMPTDENQTVCWTDEMAAAWGTVEPLMKVGNDVAARMTFKEAYTQNVTKARESGIPPKWTMSLGNDPVKREAVITEARDKGRISETYAASLLGAPAPSNAPRLGGPNALGDGIAKVLENCVKNSRHSEVAIREMAKIRKILGMPERGHSEVKPERKLLHPVKDAETIKTALDAMTRTYPTGKAENDVKTAVIEQSIDDLIAESWNDGTWPRGDIEYYRAYAQAEYNRKQGKKSQ